MYTNSYSLADNYKYEVSGAGISGVEEFETPSSKFNLNQLSSAANLTVSSYNVRVNVSINGVYQGYGNSCTINLQSAINLPDVDNGIEDGSNDSEDDSPIYLNISEQINSESIQLIAYPNPFNNNFKLEFISPDETNTIDLILYDAFGREVYNKSFEPKQINNNEFGSNLPDGVYIVNVKQGSLTLRKKIIKQSK